MLGGPWELSPTRLPALVSRLLRSQRHRGGSLDYERAFADPGCSIW